MCTCTYMHECIHYYRHIQYSPFFSVNFYFTVPPPPPHLPPSPQPFLSVFINKKAGYMYTRKYNLEVVMFNIITICKTGEELCKSVSCFLIRIQLGFFFFSSSFLQHISMGTVCIFLWNNIFSSLWQGTNQTCIDVMRFHPLPNTPDEADEQACRFCSKILSWHSY